MHTLEFDPQTEHSINQLAMHSGKSPDDLLRDIVINTIQSRMLQTTLTKNAQESINQSNWDTFFDKVNQLTRQRKAQAAADQAITDPTSPRDEIYADRLY